MGCERPRQLEKMKRAGSAMKEIQNFRQEELEKQQEMQARPAEDARQGFPLSTSKDSYLVK